MYQKLQSVTVAIAVTFVLGGVAVCFFFPSQVGQRYAALQRFPPTSNLAEVLAAAEAGDRFARLGRLDRALDSFSTAIELDPRNSFYRYERALVRLGLGDHDRYRRDCAQALEQFAEPEDPWQAFTIAWTCCLAPGAVADYSPVVRLAEGSVRTWPELIHPRLSLGAALYRAGHFQESVRQLTEADALIRGSDSDEQFLSACVWFFLAMAHQALGHPDEATRWLSAAVELTDRAMRESQQGTGPTIPWHHRLALTLLREEALLRITTTRPAGGVQT